MFDTVSGQLMHLSSPGYQPASMVSSTLELGPPGSGIPPSNATNNGLADVMVSDGSENDIIDACGQESPVTSWIEDFCSDVILKGPLGR